MKLSKVKRGEKMKGPLCIDFEALWQEGMHDWHGKMPERMTDDGLEEAFWSQSMAKKQPMQTDAHAVPIFNAMKTHIDASDSVLEIGPGWGNYTFPLQEHAKSVTCVDSSDSVLQYLKQFTREHVTFRHGKFEKLALDKHDIVLGVNCFYRMYYMNATLRKMNALANKKAIIGMTTGPIQPHYTILHEKYGYDVKFPRRDYIEIVNMLYQLGIYADCQILKLERKHTYTNTEQLVKANMKKLMDASVTQRQVEEALAPFITYENGQYIYTYPFHAAIISWTPVTSQLEGVR